MATIQFPITIPSDGHFDYIKAGLEKICGVDNYGFAGRRTKIEGKNVWAVAAMVPVRFAAATYSYLLLCLETGYITTLMMRVISREEAFGENVEKSLDAYPGRRCHVDGVGFGTILKVEERPVQGVPTWHVRVEVDAGGSQWYQLAHVELLETHPAT